MFRHPVIGHSCHSKGHYKFSIPTLRGSQPPQGTTLYVKFISLVSVKYKSNPTHALIQHRSPPWLGYENEEWREPRVRVKDSSGDPNGEVCVETGMEVTIGTGTGDGTVGCGVAPSKGVFSDAGGSAYLVFASLLQTGQNGLLVINHWSMHTE